MDTSDSRIAEGEALDSSTIPEHLDLNLAPAELRVPKASDVLANALRRQILSGELPEGYALPVERLLAAESGLSRTAVREALRILEIEGLVYTKAGRAGGSFIRRPDAQSVERTLAVFMAARQVKFRSLLELREALEPAGAELAAIYRTEEDLDVLRTTNRHMEDCFDDVNKFLLCNVDWHVAVVRASGNELMHAIIVSLSKAIHRGTDIKDFNSERIRELALAAHRNVIAAIENKDAAAARRAMDRHVHSYRVEVESGAVPDEVSLDGGMISDE
ncbi:MAG: FCD domain-containing protein [Actinomycetota bacterium]|nr:FCD domain-containing protein [Actinomycetota bacterium]